jgi:MFS family permease
LIPYAIAAIFSCACGAAENIQTVLICRFFLGFFASAPVTNTGGVLSDLWSAEDRGVAMVGYALAVLGGPTLGPVIGGALVQSLGPVGWRWTQYVSETILCFNSPYFPILTSLSQVTGLFMLLILLFDLLLLDECFAPSLLVQKASLLRRKTGNYALHAKNEEWEPTLKELGNKYLIRPFQILFTPIASLICLYGCFVYGILYSTLGAFPVVYQEKRGMNQVIGALPFLALLGGILLGAIILLWNQPYYFKKFEQNGEKAVPEARLPPMMIGSLVFAIGMFIFAWTALPNVHLAANIVGVVLVGIGFFTIFQPALNYLVDTFHEYSASAVAAMTFSRSIMAGAFPLFIGPMLQSKIGVNLGMSVFAIFGTLMIPVPFFFFYYGKQIRARGKWSHASTL